MNELIEGAKAVGQIIEASPCWFDRMCASLDKWNFLPFGKLRQKNALDKAAIQQQLEIQQQEHQARLDLLNSSIKTTCKWREGKTILALEAAKRDIEQGVSASEALKRHDPFIERSTAQLLVDSIENQYARERISLYALDAALDSPAELVGDGETSATWASRFWDYAKGVRDEDAMRQWGRLLAEEIKKPGAISLKTLDILRTLDSSDAKNFFELVPFVIDDLFIPGGNVQELGVNSYELLNLESVGLIFINKTLTLDMQVYESSNSFFDIKYLIKNKINIDITALTPAGSDLYKICAKSKEDSLKGASRFVEILKNRGIEANLSEKN